jgi:hypothetical protein
MARLRRARVLAERLWPRSDASLARNHLEWDAENLSDLLAEVAVFHQVMARAPQAPPDNLLAQELGHERAQADDVRHGVVSRMRPRLKAHL